MTGPKRDMINAITAHVMLATCNTLFIIFETPYFWDEVSPAVGIVHAALFVLTWSLLFTTEFHDPGIILRIYLRRMLLYDRWKRV